MTIRVATDIGGTFTDLVYVDEATGQYGLAKVPTTPGMYSQGILNSFRKAELDISVVSQFVHGTTMVINTITERKGSVVGLVTTRGMRDVLEIARGNRPDIYNLRYQKPKPFIPRNLRLEVRGRLDANGTAVEDLVEEDVLQAVSIFRQAGVESIAICFLHAYANSCHEKRAGDIIKRALPDTYVSLSHEITQEWREYERSNTTVLNSYVGPMTKRYLQTLEADLDEIGMQGSCYIMQSNGGMSTFTHAKRGPINLVESGPVGGVIGAAELGKILGIGNLITIDIGGTTAKTSLISGHDIKVTTDYKLEWTSRWAGYPVKVPVVDIVEIGAGGGSIGWLDEDGAVHVGPISAGADPGPAAYGRQGEPCPTVTDAQLIAGRIDPNYFLGGEMKLDTERARRAYSKLAERLGITVDHMAFGILRIVNANMINALKLVSVQRGYDPRDFTLVAMGGGGSLHAAYLARELQISRLIVPVAPGHFSAVGMLMTDLRRDYVRTSLLRIDRIDPEDLEARFNHIEVQAIAAYVEDGVASGDVRIVRAADMRYHGQEHTVHVTVAEGTMTDVRLRDLEARFHSAHEQQYSFRLSSNTEIVNLRVTAFAPLRRPEFSQIDNRESGPLQVKGTRKVWFEDEGIIETQIYDRHQLHPDLLVSGPAIIEEPASTTVIYPEMSLIVDGYGNLLIETGF